MRDSRRDNWTVEDTLYDFMFKGAQEEMKKFFLDNKEKYQAMMEEYITPELIKEALDDYDMQQWLGETIQEMVTPIIQKRMKEIQKALE